MTTPTLSLERSRPTIVQTVGELKAEFRGAPKLSLVVDGEYSDSANNVESLSIEELYPEPTARSASLDSILRLSNICLDLLSDALSALEAGESFQSDDAVIRFGQVLPELFCHRSVGDGFGAVINSIMQSLRNREVPLGASQIVVLKSVLNKIRSAPYLTFDSATDLIISLEDNDLNVDPAGFNDVADLLCS